MAWFFLVTSIADKPLTLGMLFWPAVIIGSLLIFLGIIAFLLSIFADAWKH